MDIKIGKYRIVSDSMSMILSMTKVYGKDSKRKGEEYEEVIGYFTDIISVFDRLMTHRMMTSDAKDLRMLIDIIADIKLLVKESLSIHLDKETIDMAKETAGEKVVKTGRIKA